MWYAPCLFPCYMQTSCLHSYLKSTFFVLAMGSKWEIKATVCSSPWIQYWERESESLFYSWPVPFMSFLAYLFQCPSRWEDAGPITCWEQDAWEVDQQLSAPTPRPLFRTRPLPRGPEAISMQSSTKNTILSRLSVITHLSCLFWVIKMYIQPNKWLPPFRSSFDTSGILK